MAIIDTSNPVYQNKLAALTDLWTQFKSVYGPVVKGMNSTQLKELRQHDPMFAKFIEIGQDISTLAQKVGLEL
jgi:hypothetical protein